MNSPFANDHNAAEWESLVGKAILRFGDIELVSIKCLSIIPEEKIAESASRLSLVNRADLIIELLENRHGLDDHMSCLLPGFKQAKQLAGLRNQIAHNPVMLDVYINEDEARLFSRHSITSARTGKQSLNLEDLKEFSSKVEQLSSELWMAFLNVAQSAEPLWQPTSN